MDLNNNTHAKVEWGKSQEASTVAKNHRPLRSSERGEMVFPGEQHKGCTIPNEILTCAFHQKGLLFKNFN